MPVKTKSNHIDLQADVLVIGGGAAGTWAAITAAKKGAKVVLVDKGYCGSSGATAPSGTGVWYVQPEEELREEAKKSRFIMGGSLAENDWMDRVLDRTYELMNQIEIEGYPFPIDDTGKTYKRGLQGPEYMRLMRKLVRKAGVKILDHSPALELLRDEYGVGGAVGRRTQTNETWRVEASAVIIATGGCAFLSKALGCNVLTGDGYLMSAEAGAQFSGMEFSNAYAIAPLFSSITKTAYYNYATFYYKDGTVIEGAGSRKGRSVIARKLQEGIQVYARLDQAPLEIRDLLRVGQRNFFLPFDRFNIDPFTDLFPVTLRLEGTVRGTGGINVVNEWCSSGVPGLYAAGDAATRELICGGFTGGGSHNSAWAMSSGSFSGEGAAEFAASLGKKRNTRLLSGVSSANWTTQSGMISENKTESLIQGVKQEVTPFDRNLFRTETTMRHSLERLHELWEESQHEPLSLQTNQVVKAREAAAMIATARWMYTAAIERKESRGMHKRMDYRELDPNQSYRLISGGLDQLWVKPLAEKKEVLL